MLVMFVDVQSFVLSLVLCAKEQTQTQRSRQEIRRELKQRNDQGAKRPGDWDKVIKTEREEMITTLGSSLDQRKSERYESEVREERQPSRRG